MPYTYALGYQNRPQSVDWRQTVRSSDRVVAFCQIKISHIQTASRVLSTAIFSIPIRKQVSRHLSHSSLVYFDFLKLNFHELFSYKALSCTSYQLFTLFVLLSCICRIQILWHLLAVTSLFDGPFENKTDHR